jgi:phosphodiester glycosidase
MQTIDEHSLEPEVPAPTRPSRRHRERQRRRARRRVRWYVAGGVVVLLAVPAWSLGRVLLADNTDPLSVRVVEWAKGHHMSGVVNSVEHFWYSHHQPKKGGTPRGGIPIVAQATKSKPKSAPRCSAHAPAAMTPFVADPLPREGSWQAVGRNVGCGPVAWATFLRPDPVHTSELAGVVHFDMQHLKATLHAGTDIPGGSGWLNGPRIDPSQYGNVVGAFNSAFTIKASHGGYYAEGRTVAPLVDGRASLVTYRDGHADVALWGRDATMTPDVTAVRQNLTLLVDNGQVSADAGTTWMWGGTVGNKVFVWRSAVCVDAHHDLIYAAGPGLDVATLAALMQRAGCWRAMELDINSWWISLMTFASDGHGGVVPTKLLNSMERTPSRYLETGTRDFVEIDAK